MSTPPPGDELFDEARLRRALRLESGELPPRLDLALVVARARGAARVAAFAATASTVVAGVAGASLVGLSALAVSTLAPAIASESLAALLTTTARVGIAVDGILGVAQQPSVPIAAIAALGLAAAYEYRQRRELADAARTT